MKRSPPTCILLLGGLVGWLVLAPHVLAPQAHAQGISALQESDEPLEINADDGIEWQRDNNVYIARGNARAAQGDVELFADTLTAYYRKGEDDSSQIYQVDADGNVRIVTAKEEAYGDHATYNVDNGLFTLTGDDIRLIAEQDTITARDSLEYWERDQIAVARGDAVAIREDKRIMADTLIARLVEAASGKTEIDRVDAEGNVQISTETEYARGNRGIYYVTREVATLTGDVKVTRDGNQLNGEYAEVNLKTGISKLLGAPPDQTGSSRVRAILVPNQKPDAEQQ